MQSPVSTDATETNQSSTFTTGSEQPAFCPHCQERLYKMMDSIWCPKCGDPSAVPVSTGAEARTKGAEGARKSDSSDSTTAFPNEDRTTWILKLVMGIVLIVAGALAFRLFFQDQPKVRAYWMLAQTFSGVIVIILVQIAALELLGTQRQQFEMFDLFVPGRIWMSIFARLPVTRRHVSIGAWGLTLTITAVACIGGFDYFLPTKKMARTRPKFVAALDGGNASEALEDSVKNFSNSVDFNKDKEKKEQPKTVTSCVIVGYKGNDVFVHELVLATVENKELYFAGMVKVRLRAEQSRKLMKDLSSLRTKRVIFPDLNSADIRWVLAKVPCEVEHTGFNTDGEMRKPRLTSLGKEREEVPEEKTSPGE